jgi:hypothetical protein
MLAFFLSFQTLTTSVFTGILSSREDVTSAKPLIEFDLNEKQEYKVVLFNSNLSPKKELVNFKVNSANVEVLKSDGSIVENVQLSLVWPNTDGELLASPTSQLKIQNTGHLKHGLHFDGSYFELLFQVELKPLAFETFTIRNKLKSDNYVDRLAKTTFLQKDLDSISEEEAKLKIKQK